MSAIWGAIQLQGKKIPVEKSKRMKEVFGKYKIDRTEEYISDTVILGCGIQYFTKESKYEKLPYANEAEGIYFTADVILDNREELLKDLKLQEEKRIIPDGELLLEVYRKYGNECLNKILGSYVFVFYKKEENEIYVVADAVGSRCLYYKYEQGTFQFASVIEALHEEAEKKKINERWVTDFLGIDNLMVMTECEETIYQGINKIRPAYVFKITASGIEKKQYWNVSKKELKLKSDEEYKNRFIEVFGEAVRCLIRGDKTAMTLSGGLDSSAVACFAAPELKKRGEKLYTFTAIPEEGYVSELKSYQVPDESEKVKKTAEFLGNVECRFIDLKGEDSWTAHFKIRKGVEIPYKSAQNLQWLMKSLEEAYQMGARIVLEGGYGNTTISYGNATAYMNTLLSEKRFITYIKEMNYYAKKYGWRKKYTCKTIFEVFGDYFFSKTDKEENVLERAYIKESKVEELKPEERIAPMYQRASQKRADVMQRRATIFDENQLSHKGEFKTKESLMTGAVFRDPCLDKRVIEFCASLPMEQYCYHGTSRRLIREYLEGIVPDHIIKIEDFGYQSADMMMKVKKNWAHIYGEMKQLYEKNRSNSIVDVETALKDMEKLGEDITSSKRFDFTRLLYTAMVLEIMEENDWK
ncbi:MAG: hypothetical protein IJA36_01225 [Lachnospiraceae bacterium]|nr:hypothetical protein [Lachnospiraceae bacterium]